VKEIERFLANKAADDSELTAVDGVDLSNHLDVFHAVLRQVTLVLVSFIQLSQTTVYEPLCVLLRLNFFYQSIVTCCISKRLILNSHNRLITVRKL